MTEDEAYEQWKADDVDRVQRLREEALEAQKAGNVVMRSCWKCNSSHVHLKQETCLIVCFVCGHWYYKGEDVTEVETPR